MYELLCFYEHDANPTQEYFKTMKNIQRQLQKQSHRIKTYQITQLKPKKVM